MMPWRMKIHGTGLICPVYLESYDVNAHGGRGSVAMTVDGSKALIWPDIADVLAAWKEQSTVLPLRPDGKPNRPLSAFTIEPERCD